MLRSWVRLNMAAVRHNVLLAHKYAPHSKVIAVVKSDAYGHGMLDVALETLAEANAYAVASLEEAIELRTHLQENPHPIVCLSGLISEQQIPLFEANKISPVLFDANHVAWMTARPKRFEGDVWLKLNTGMNRAGIQPTEVDEAYAMLSKVVKGNIKLMSHFSDADAPDKPQSREQLQVFEAATNHISTERSLANSAGILGQENAHFEWIRPGIMLYGSSPFSDEVSRKHGMSAADLSLQAVMSFEARLLRIDTIDKGDSIGYGSTWKANRSTRVGLVSCGYGDGYPRVVAGGTQVLINNERANVIGRVSMDSLTIDLTNLADAGIGDVVQLWGDQLPVDEVASWANTISYELLCKVTSRPTRIIENSKLKR